MRGNTQTTRPDNETQKLRRIHGRIEKVEHPEVKRAAGELKQLISEREKK